MGFHIKGNPCLFEIERWHHYVNRKKISDKINVYLITTKGHIMKSECLFIAKNDEKIINNHFDGS